MTQNIFDDDFHTKLGTVRIWIESDSNQPAVNITKEEDNYHIVTKGHDIYLQSFEVKKSWELDKSWIYKEPDFETSRGWRWFITKTVERVEKLTIICKLIDPPSDVQWGHDCGENLYSLDIRGTLNGFHIGTEDGEMMSNRADQEDWMPERFKDALDENKCFTEMEAFGFKTTVPDLQLEEKIYFHYIVATSSKGLKEDDQYIHDSSTWFAVDQLKKTLDLHLGRIY